MATKLVIKGREVFDIKAIPETKQYATGTKMEGQSYLRFAYGDSVFIANTADKFIKDFDAENLYSVTLQIDDAENLSLLSHTTVKQELTMATTETKLKAISSAEYAKALMTNPEELSAL